MCNKQKSDFLKKIYYILIILVDFNVNLFLFPGSGSTLPEVNPDPAK